MKRIAVLGLVLALAALSLPAKNKKDKKAEAEALLARAREVTDIRAEGSTPFQLRAVVRLYDLEKKGEFLEGTYELLWASPRHWKETITFPGYELLHIAEGTILWEKGTTPNRPYRISRLQKLMRYPSPLQLGTDEKIRKVKEREYDGVRLLCIETKGKLRGQKFCFNPSNGMIERAETRDRAILYYSGAIAIDSHLFPRILKKSRKKQPQIAVQVEDLTPRQEIPDSAFAPPEGSTSRAWCQKPDPPKQTNNVPPSFPFSARRAGHQGSILIYATIGSDGVPKHLEIIESAEWPDLNSAALEAVRQSRYAPATCNSTPVEFQIAHRIVFRQ